MLLLGALFTVLLCTSALAADATKGIVKDSLIGTGVTLTAKTANGDAQDGTVDGKTVYADAERIGMQVATTSGTEYLVFVLKGENATVPMASNIVYIDQESGTGGNVDFNLYPSSLANGEYTICMATSALTGGDLKTVGSFEYYASYTPGEVDGKEGINSRDAQFVLQHSLGLRTFTETQKLAADVDGKPGINSRDAQFILQASLGLRKLS